MELWTGVLLGFVYGYIAGAMGIGFILENRNHHIPIGKFLFMSLLWPVALLGCLIGWWLSD